MTSSRDLENQVTVLFEDNHLVAVFKPHRVLTQSDETGELSLLEMTKDWLKEKYQKPGNVFLGLLHRLDRPAAGIVLFAKTSKAASRLSEQFREHRVKKLYWALVEGRDLPLSGQLTHYLQRHEGKPALVFDRMKEGLQKAELSYQRLKLRENVALVEVELKTGRKHQIRAQFSSMGHPLLGDVKYGSQLPFRKGALALVAKRLECFHPVRSEEKIIIDLPLSFTPEFERFSS